MALNQDVPNSSADVSRVPNGDFSSAVAAVAGMGGGSIYNPQDPMVFLGRKQTPQNLYVRAGMDPGEAARLVGIQGVNAQNLSTVKNQYYGWDDNLKARFRAQLGLAGLDSERMNDAQLAEAWGAYSEQAASYYMNGTGRELTPWDIMAMDMKNREAAGPKTSTQTTFNLSTGQDAKYMATQAAKSMLGRDPTDAEVAALLSGLNQAERSNPTVTSTTTQPTGESESTTSGGLSEAARAQIAQDQMKAKPEYAEYQASTTYMNAALELIMRGY